MTVEIIGHRGATGLYPELSLAGFAKALELGVDGLEMDVAVTADREVVTYHDHTLNPEITRGPDGNWLTDRGARVSDLTLTELKSYDIGCVRPGSDYAKRFPTQAATDNNRIPTLEEIVELAREGGCRPAYFIEVKVYSAHPYSDIGLEECVRTIVDEIERLGISESARIHSFDWHMLHQFRKYAPHLHYAHLTCELDVYNTVSSGDQLNDASRVINEALRHKPGWTDGLSLSDYGDSIPRMIEAVGGTDWHANHQALTEERISEAHNLGIQVYAWTANEIDEYKRLLEAGIDGIITDYPNRLIEFIRTG